MHTPPAKRPASSPPRREVKVCQESRDTSLIRGIKGTLEQAAPSSAIGLADTLQNLNLSAPAPAATPPPLANATDEENTPPAATDGTSPHP